MSDTDGTYAVDAPVEADGYAGEAVEVAATEAATTEAPSAEAGEGEAAAAL